jgi:hypothetical protein
MVFSAKKENNRTITENALISSNIFFKPLIQVIGYCFSHSYIALSLLHLLPSGEQELPTGSGHSGRLLIVSHVPGGSCGVSAALWRRLCCCWDTVTVRAIAETRTNINKTPIVLDWVGSLMKSITRLRKPIVDL